MLRKAATGQHRPFPEEHWGIPPATSCRVIDVFGAVYQQAFQHQLFVASRSAKSQIFHATVTCSLPFPH
jgi:hypothetical protein